MLGEVSASCLVETGNGGNLAANGAAEMLGKWRLAGKFLPGNDALVAPAGHQMPRACPLAIGGVGRERRRRGQVFLTWAGGKPGVPLFPPPTQLGVFQGTEIPLGFPQERRGQDPCFLAPLLPKIYLHR